LVSIIHEYAIQIKPTPARAVDIYANVDLHAHPSLKVSLFNRVLTSRFRASRSFDPFGARMGFPELK
jgi:hypothetical protein